MIKRKLLITCGGGIYTKSIIESLSHNQKFSFVLCDCNPHSILFIEKSFKTYLVPSAEDTSREEYIEAISKIIFKEKISYIIPMSDKEAIYLKRSQFQSITLSAEKNICQLFANKYLTIVNLKKILNENYTINIIKKKTKINSIFQLNREKFYCIKPNEGRGGRGFKIIGSKEKLEEIYKVNYLDFNEVDEYISKYPHSGEFILMDYFQGQDFNIDVSCHNGELYDISIQKRIEQINGPLINGQIENNALIYKFIKSFVMKANASGIFNIELILTKYGYKNFKPIIYEINPRPSAAISFTESTNPGYIERAIKLLEGNKIKPTPFIKDKIINIRRVWINEIS